jgi:uncharacterized protein YbjQ (UPF0145 family)
VEPVFALLIFLGPLILFGLIIGRTVERRHLQRLDEREAIHRDVLITQVKTFPMAVIGGQTPAVVMSEAVIASDYLKTFLAGWRNIFGGEVRSFRMLQERAKREAILRLIERAVSQGFNAVCNVRVSGADIGGNTSGGKNKVPMAAIMATGTAYQARIPQS